VSYFKVWKFLVKYHIQVFASRTPCPIAIQR
jgi:hypothetical protein